MSECTTTFRQYHERRLRSAIPAIFFAGISMFLMSLSTRLLYGRYDDLLTIVFGSVGVSVALFLIATMVHEVCRRQAISGSTRASGTDEVIKKRSATKLVLGVILLDVLMIYGHANLWEAGLATWRARRCVQAEQYDDALAWADEFVRLVPRSPDAYQRRAAIWLKLGDPQKALNDYVRAADVDRKRWDTVEVLLEKLIEHGTADSFWSVYDLTKSHHPEQSAQYLKTHSNLPKRSPLVPSPADSETPRTEPHEPDESGRLVRRV
jgi:hypothetical protein